MPIAMTRFQRGFTLIEAVVVITITSIVAAVVAELTDTADTAVRRIARDLRLALPNSVRVTGGNQAIEFLSTRDGGRYRVELGSGAGDILDFTQADTTFDILGPAITFAAGDQIVIYNLGIPGADAYEGNTAATHNRRAYNGATGSVNNVQITSTNPFPFDSPAHRFQVVDTPVSYICSGGILRRYWGYTITAAQPNPPAGGNSAQLAQNVTTCIFTYTPGVTQRNGLVSIRLSLTQSNETVNLYHEVHVNNVP